MSELKLMSLNCRGLGGQEKRRDVIHYLRNIDFDIYLLQDTHLTQRTVPNFNALWRGKCYHSCGTFNSRGTSILFKPHVQHSIIYEEYCQEGNFVILVCTIFLNTYTIINIYGPNEDRPSFFHCLNKKLEELNDENIIIAGDFNFVADYKVDSNYSQQNNVHARNAFADIMCRHNLIDAWRDRNPNGQMFTWSKQNPLKFGRLDMFFIQEHMRSTIISTDAVTGYRSDHSIITLNIKEPRKKKGPGLWKFNESLLNDEAYDNLITKVIIDTVHQYAVPVYEREFISDPFNYNEVEFTISAGLFYETLLMTIRGETVRFSKQKARSTREREIKQMHIINTLQKEFDLNQCSADLLRLEEAKALLEEIRKPKIMGLITRSRVNWFEEGERCTKYFLSLEKRNTTKKSIQSLKVDTEVTTNKQKILDLFSENLKQKYQKQFSLRNSNEYLKMHIKRKLSETQKRALDEPISLEELRSALVKMKKGKSPGSNGFTADFFKHFWRYIGVFLYRAFSEALNNQTILKSHQESIVTFIPKHGKPINSLKGWRPISLLNVDFKIISTAVAKRLKSVSNFLISPSKTAYINGRFIGENSRLVFDVIEHLNCSSKRGLIIGVDFESAFDTVSWEFLLNSLDHYNFGPYYKQLVQAFYLNSSNFARIIMDGYLGPKIEMSRGIRQGDPASGYLFNLIMEPLANQFMQSRHMQGIPISPNAEVRISQYADDLIIFSSAEPNSVVGVMKELKEFENFSGLHVNVEKTKCLQVGQQRHEAILNSLGLTVVDELKILGITFCRNNNNITSNNILPILPKISFEVAQWRRRNLTLMGKITVVKSLLLSKLVHILSALPDPTAEDIKQINNIFFKFIWNIGTDKIKRVKIVQSYINDGLKMIDLKSFVNSLKISWLKRLYWAQIGVPWAHFAKHDLPPVEDLVTFGSTKLQDLKTKIQNAFWRDVVSSWAEFLRVYTPDNLEVLTDKLWYSDHTRFKRTIVKDWNNKGFRFILDLFCKDTGFLLTREMINEKFGLNMTFLCYSSLVRSIPIDIRNACWKNIKHPVIPYKVALLSRNSETSRIAYNKFIFALFVKYGSVPDALERKWARDAGTMVKGTLLDIRNSTKNIYLQTFHYRIVNRIISTNTFLFRIGLSENPSCSFCKSSNETLIHILWDCRHTQRYIEELKSHLSSTYNMRLNIDLPTWVFPTLANVNRITVLIITLAKVVIFKARNAACTPSIRLFHNLLKWEAEKESYAAKRTNALNSFLEKWENVSSILRV